ncbi:MAG: HD domain-containing protein, partial [Chitinivibrionales bacterium]|nr:HD domain-containing protein [Chitinivibrionales bacterium]
EPAPAAPLEVKDLKRIKAGKAGLQQLNRTSITTELDELLKRGRTVDRPVGPSLGKNAVEITARERTDKYKGDIQMQYQAALGEVGHVLNSLAKGSAIDGLQVIDVVKRFVKVFVTDRNILLNISGIKHTGDDYFYHHSLNVCLLSINIAAAYGYSEKQVVEIGMGALLHDLGMLLVPKEIVQKKGRLAQEEWYEIQKHPVMGLHLLEKIRRLPESVPYVAYQVHERENRTGYPKQRTSRLIHQFAKIVQVADVYEAMSSPRSYRSAFIPYESMERLIKMTRQGLISGEFVKAFLRYASLFPVGSLVQLNDQRIAKVIRANGDSYAKPIVSILTTTEGKVLPKPAVKEENLSSNIELFISRALSPNHVAELSIMDGF